MLAAKMTKKQKLTKSSQIQSQRIDFPGGMHIPHADPLYRRCFALGGPRLTESHAPNVNLYLVKCYLLQIMYVQNTLLGGLGDIATTRKT